MLESSHNIYPQADSQHGVVLDFRYTKFQHFTVTAPLQLITSLFFYGPKQRFTLSNLFSPSAAMESNRNPPYAGPDMSFPPSENALEELQNEQDRRRQDDHHNRELEGNDLRHKMLEEEVKRHKEENERLKGELQTKSQVAEQGLSTPHRQRLITPYGRFSRPIVYSKSS